MKSVRYREIGRLRGKGSGENVSFKTRMEEASLPRSRNTIGKDVLPHSAEASGGRNARNTEYLIQNWKLIENVTN